MALLVLVFMLVALPVDAWADHVVLKNGDTLTGTVTAMSATDVTLVTELAGRVVIKRASIVSLTSSRFSLGGPAPDPAAAWQGAINTGWDMSRGNAETATISTYGNATRLGPSDRLGLFGAYLFSNVGSGSDAVTTAKAVRAWKRASLTSTESIEAGQSLTAEWLLEPEHPARRSPTASRARDLGSARLRWAPADAQVPSTALTIVVLMVTSRASSACWSCRVPSRSARSRASPPRCRRRRSRWRQP